MQSLFAVFDAWYVAKLGATAVATVGIAEGIIMIVVAVALGLGVGATAIVARRVGERRPKAANTAGVQAVILAFILAVVLGIAGVTFTPEMMRLMGAPKDVMESGLGFTTHLLGGSGTIILLFVINAVFRGLGEPGLALKSLALANLLNLLLDPIFIFGFGPIPAMGVTGAAVATNLARSAGVVYQLRIFARGHSPLQLSPQQLMPQAAVIRSLVKVSWVAVLQFFIATLSYTGMIRIMTAFPSEAVAGLTLGVRILMFIFLPAWGLCNAAATLVGQNLGAKSPERAEASVWLAARWNALYMGGVTLVFILLAPSLIRLFTPDPEIVINGAKCLTWISLSLVPLAFGMVTLQAFNGAGDTWTPTYVGLLCHWIIKLPLSFFLAHHWHFGPEGIYIASPIAEITTAILGVLLFKSGRWKEKRL